MSEVGLSPHLQNALKQTSWTKELPTRDSWRHLLYEVVQKADWQKVILDMQNSFENPSDLNLLTQANILKLIKARL